MIERCPRLTVLASFLVAALALAAPARAPAAEPPLPDGAIAQIGALRLRHEAAVSAIAWSPDSATLASGGDDRRVRLWNAATGRLRGELAPSFHPVRCLAFSPDGALVAAPGKLDSVRLADARTGATVRELKAPYGAIEALALAFVDGGRILLAFADARIIGWDVSSGKLLPAAAALKRETGSLGAPPMSFSPDGRAIAGTTQSIVNGEPRQFYIFAIDLDPILGREVQKFSAKLGAAVGLAFSPDGKAVATGHGDGDVRLWDVASPTTVPRAVGSFERKRVERLAFSPDGKRLAAAARNVYAARVIDVESGTDVALPRGTGEIGALAFSPDGKVLAVAEGARVRLFGTDTWAEMPGEPDDLGGSAKAIAFADGGAWLVAEVEGRGPVAFDARTWDRRAAPARTEDGEAIRRAALSADGARSITFDREVARVWDAATRKEVCRVVARDRSQVLAAAIAPDGKTIAVARSDGAVVLCDATTGREVRAIAAAAGPVTAVAFSADGVRLAAGTGEGAIDVFAVATGARARELPGHFGRVTALAFAPGGAALASAGADASIVIWNVTSGGDR